MSWPTVPLVKTCDFVRGPFGGALKKEIFVEDGYAIYEQQHAIYDQFSDIRYFVNEVKFRELKRFELNPGDLIMSCSGTMGKIALVPEGIKSGIINQALLKLTPQKNVDVIYLKHFMESRLFQSQLEDNTQGAAIKNVASVAVLKELKIPLPPLPEQKRIAAILDKADAIRRKRQQAIKLADDFLRSVFLEMFGDPVTNPKGFKKVPITELANVITGFAFKSNEYISDSQNAVQLCRGANTLTGYLDWDDTAYWPKNKLEKLEGYLIQAGDIILAMDRPWISSGLKVCIFPENERETYLVQRVARLRPHGEIYTDYIYSCINSQAFEKHCCPTETTVPHISPVELKNFEVLLPNPELIESYHSIVSVIKSSVKKMVRGKSSSDDIFNSLSQKAFSGGL